MNIEKQFKGDVRLFDLIKKRHWKAIKQLYKFNAKESLKNISIDIKSMEKVIDKRNNELTIIKDFNLVLGKVKPETYWVFNFKSMEEYVKRVNERKKQVALYKRKIAMLNSRLATVKLYNEIIKKKL